MIRKWDKEHPEKVKEIKHRWYLRNKDKHKKRGKEWRIVNREKDNENHRNWRKKNPEEARAIKRRFKKNNRETVRTAYNRYYGRHKKKVIARMIAQKNINLEDSICQICDKKQAVHRHHPNYDNPLEIIPCCESCHIKLHQKILQ
jgi:hypothetical protein